MKVSCGARRTAVCVAVLVFAFSSAPSRASAQTTVQQPFGLAVYDLNNKKVGNALGAGPGSPTVAFQIPLPSGGLQLVTLMVARTSFFGSGGGGGLVFLTSNCTGQAYFMLTSAPGFDFLGPPVQVLGANQTVYIPDPARTPTSTAPSTTLYTVAPFGPAGQTCNAFTPGGSFQFVEALALIDLTGPNGLFTPPFSLRATDNVLLGY